MSYPLDQPIRLSFLTYSDAAEQTPADATTVTLYVTDPAGVESTYTLAGAQVVRETTGTYHYDLTPTLPGHYKAHWKATGAVATGQDEGFDVDPRYGPWITVDDVTADLNLTGTTGRTSELRGIIDAACAILENHPAYRISDAVKTATYTEWADAGETVMLDHYPITAVASVAEYTNGIVQAITHEPIDGGSFTGYGWDYADGTGKNGILVRLSGGTPVRWCGNRVKIVYTAGTTSVPADLRLAALLLVEHLWETQRGTGGQGLPSGEQLPEGQPDFTFGSTFILPNRVREALEPYRKAPAVA